MEPTVYEQLREIGYDESESKRLILSHPEEKIKRAIEVTKDKYRDNAVAFFRAALANGWEPVSVRYRKKPANITRAPKELKKVDENIQPIFSEENRQKGREALLAIKGIITQNKRGKDNG